MAAHGALRISILFIFLFLISCDSKKYEVKDLPVEKAVVKAPDFNADSAYYFTKTQVDFGPRIPQSKAHELCAAYLISKVKSYTPHVVVQKTKLNVYDGQIFDIQNIIASFNPESKQRLLLFAHWDTRPWADQDEKDLDKPIDGASDGASGVAVLLEVARQLSLTKVNIGVDIAFFDLEDYGKSGYEDSYALGTQYWCKNKHLTNYTANYGILLDMVGAKNATFLMEGNSMVYANSFTRKVWDTAAQLGYSNYFIYRESGPITDDHFYVNTMANIPSIDIIHYDAANDNAFADYWHTHNDNMDVIDRATLKAVGQTLLQVVYNE